MALRAVLGHVKFDHLQSLLGQPKAFTLGCLECLWHFCGRFTPQGNIGKYTDDQIEAWLGWPGEKGALVAALIEARWIDRDPTHRLLVHDWANHADDATKLALKRAELTFAVPTSSTVCPDSVPTTSRLPGAGAEPVPEPDKSFVSPSGSTSHEAPDLWEEFLAIYPKRNGATNKTQAKVKFRAIRDPVPVIAGVKKFRAWSDATGKTGTEFIPQMTTWLNGKRWLEDYEIPESNGKPKTPADYKAILLGGEV